MENLMDLGRILPLWSVSFFVIMLLMIAILPLTHGKFWESNKNKAIVSAVVSIPVILLFVTSGNLTPILHEMKEYFSFMVLLGSLFVVSGGIFLSGDIEANPKNNTFILLTGGILANIFGTTGAAMLLIRPLLRTNSERQFTSHIPIFFIFIVCNIGGCLTPIGDPPLFMGYLRGVNFFWTLKLFPEWLFMLTAILAVFFAFDSYYWKKETPAAKLADKTHIEPIKIHGTINLIFISIILLSVILIHTTPYREIIMIFAAVLSVITTKKEVREKNEFNYAPIIEVAVLFAGIFITMVPALLILETRGGEIGVQKPWQFFWATGGLSAFLDNTPTYLTFLSLGQGLAISMNLPKDIIGIPVEILKAISLGAVFMGATTYIGNGPNFMVKAICENQKVKMPSFFGYMLWSVCILIPLFILVTLIFF